MKTCHDIKTKRIPLFKNIQTKAVRDGKAPAAYRPDGAPVTGLASLTVFFPQ